MTLVELTRWDGRVVYVNPAHVLTVEPAAKDGRARVRFALMESGAGTGSPLVEEFSGTPEVVAGLLNEEVGAEVVAAFAEVYGPRLEPLPLRDHLEQPS